jgi:hypothetical protein
MNNSFRGNNSSIRVNQSLSQFEEISSILKENDIPYNVYYPSIEKPPKALNLSFGCETDFHDLFILVSNLKNLNVQLIYYSHEVDNMITIGTYATESKSDEKFSVVHTFDFVTEGVKPEILLTQQIDSSINQFLRAHYNVLTDDIDSSLKKWISQEYDIDNPSDCTEEEAERVREISCKEKGIKTLNGLDKFKKIERIYLSDNKITDFDLSPFPNLKELDCSYCPVKKLNITGNSLLEYIRYEGLRGNYLGEINFSGNPNLKKIIGGQDGISQIDLSNNQKVEEIDIRLSQNFRYIDVSACRNLKRIRLWGVLVPFVDLTKNKHLEHVEINYLNTYKGKDDEFGSGYPRPFIFVNDDFDRNTINSQDLQYEYYTHLLVRVKKDSNEDKVLQELHEMKLAILDVSNVGSFHYEIREKLGIE